MDIANDKLGPCPQCFDHIKPCRCEMVLKSDLRKLVDEIEAGRLGNQYVMTVDEILVALKTMTGT